MRTPGDTLDRRSQRRQVRLDIRRLPRPLRRLLQPVRNPFVLEGVLTRLDDDLEVVAGTPVRNLHEADRIRWMAHLAGQRGFRQRVLNSTHAERRRCHLDWVQGSDREVLPASTQAVLVPTSGQWEVAEDLGLGTAAYLEAMPDEVALGLVQEMISRAQKPFELEDWTQIAADLGVAPEAFEAVGLEDEPDITIRVLVVGAGPSTLAHAVDAVGSREVGVRLVEVEPIQSERATLCVEARHQDLADVLLEGERFDEVVFHLPAPAGTGAANHRFLYYGDPNMFEVPTPDLGRLGPKKWSRRVVRMLETLPALIKPDAAVHIYVPWGVRERQSYRACPELVAPPEQVLGDLGFSVARSIDVFHSPTIAQPFVAHHRCPWHLVSALRRVPCDD